MKKLTVAMAVLALLLIVTASTALPAIAAPGRPDSYIVVYRDNIPDQDARTNALERAHGFAADFRYNSALKGFAARLNPGQLQRLQVDPDVAFISYDATVQAVGMVDLVGTDMVPTGVQRIGAGTATSVHQASDVGVAVIDTGIDLSHPDLNAVNGKNCILTRKTAADDNGHGSHVAGTIAARNNGSGVAGVAPDTKLYAVKVLNSSGSGRWSQVICGIDWVTANAASLNIKVASMSLGGGGSNDNNCGKTNRDAMHKAICSSVNAGVTYVVAAGNEGSNFAGSVPAAYPEVLTVTAMSDSDGQAGGTGGAPACRTGEHDDDYASFSNYAVAQKEIDHTIAAPGVCIKSTWMKGGYNIISGTSMATPHVSGVVALCFGSGGEPSSCAGKTPAQVIQLIRSDAAKNATESNGFVGDPSHPISRKYFGYLAWGGY